MIETRRVCPLSSFRFRNNLCNPSSSNGLSLFLALDFTGVIGFLSAPGGATRAQLFPRDLPPSILRINFTGGADKNPSAHLRPAIRGYLMSAC
jgi:hypothetical protein